MKNIILAIVITVLAIATFLGVRYFQQSEIALDGTKPDTAPISADRTPMPDNSSRNHTTGEQTSFGEVSALFDEDRPLPDLEESDDILRQTFEPEDPYTRSLLERDHIIRKLAAAVDLVWSKKNPARHFGFWGLNEGFQIETREGKTQASPLNYQRYDLPVQALEKLDLALLGKSYRRLQPLFEIAFDELGNENTQWEDRVLEVADQITGFHTPSEPAEVIGQDNIYIYVDPKIEALPPIHKLLLRMGPAHAARVQRVIEQIKPYLRESPSVKPFEEQK